MGNEVIPPRFEFKYLVPLRQVDVIRRMIEPYCVLDEFADKEPKKRYVITSLYLDTPTLGCWNAWNLGADRRFKLRIRRYGHKLGDSPVFFETKERVMDLTIKPRILVPPAQWLSRARDGVGQSADERDFCIRRSRYRLQPTMLVRYEREAWEGRIEAYARVTFDQRLQYQRCDAWTLEGDEGWYQAADDAVAFEDDDPRTLVEIKFEREIPRWMTHLMRTLELERRGCSKYGIGVLRTFNRGE
ncbi:MAG TPA: polyphosphate polymerase domain-containing protein, partial [Myxococcota bacterium]